jgi:Domain of unknown function (DUF1772)
MMSRLSSGLALALAAAFFGIALYINLAEQPARLALADGPLLEAWKISFGVGFILQSSLTIAAALAALATWWLRRDWRWLVGGLLMIANLPWTLIVVAPINNALIAISIDGAGPASRALIEQWGFVHSGRTAVSLLAVGMFLWANMRDSTE